MKIKELLTDSSKWTKGEYARDKNNKSVWSNNVNAISWCLMGATQKCYPNRPTRIKLQSIISHYLGYDDITSWNDATRRTFADVRDLIEELDI